MDFWNNLEEAIGKTQKREENHDLKQEDIFNDSEITQLEWELAKKLEAIEEFTVDRFEEEYAILEDRKTGKMKHVLQSQLPKQIEEGDILLCIHGKYIINKDQTQIRQSQIEEKTKDLWEE
jgi:tRNA G37 N-methylase Trm5